MSLAALDGDPGACGEADGFGLVDSQDARALVAAASRNPKTRWCVTALHPDATAAAHACASGQHCWSAGQQAAAFLGTLNLTLTPVIRGPCDHAQAQRAYRPSRSLRHLVNARNTRCTAPGTRSPEPSYLQLARQLRDRIRDGRIEPGGALPSITYLTGETGLAVQTVRRGIAVLVEEGWAVTVPGRGTYAAEKPPE